MSEPAPAPPRLGRLRRILRRARRIAVRTGLALIGLFVLALVVFTIWLNVATDRGTDLLLVTIDTQRIDGLGCYGGEAGRSPNLDRLAARGVLFEQSVVSIPRTTQNVSTLLTGLEPRDHGVRDLFDSLPDDVVTLAESLRAAGYRTGAFVGGGPLGMDQNLYQGFDHTEVHAYDDEIRSPRTMAGAAAWITRNASGPWFAWVHVYDPHFFYAPLWPFWDPWHPEIDGVNALYEDVIHGRRTRGEVHFGGPPPAARHEHLVELYRGETRLVDHALGWLMRVVRLYELLDPGRRTLVVVTADHGESLGEHKTWYQHGNFLYDEDLLVPLLMALPDDLPAGVRVPWQTRAVDVMPTILDLLGQPAPERIGGRSLLPMVRGEEAAHRLAFAEGDTNRYPENSRFHYADGLQGRWRTVRDGRFKLIRIPHPDGDRFELYDLERDPGEKVDLTPAEPATLERLKALLAEWESRPARGADVERKEMSEEEAERLRSLGYVN